MSFDTRALKKYKYGGLITILPVVVLVKNILSAVETNSFIPYGLLIFTIMSALFLGTVFSSALSVEKNIANGDSYTVCLTNAKSVLGGYKITITGAAIALVIWAVNRSSGKLSLVWDDISILAVALLALCSIGYFCSKSIINTVEEITCQPGYGNYITKNIFPKLNDRQQGLIARLPFGNKFWLLVPAVFSVIYLTEIFSENNRYENIPFFWAVLPFVVASVLALPFALLSDKSLKTVYNNILSGLPKEDSLPYLQKSRTYYWCTIAMLTVIWMTGWVTVGENSPLYMWSRSVNASLSAVACRIGTKIGTSSVLKEIEDALDIIYAPQENEM